jgi:hypothetical protein
VAMTQFHHLLTEPNVFVISSGVSFKSGLRHCLLTTGEKRCHIVVQPSWYVQAHVRHVREIVDAVRETRAHRPDVGFSVICPTAEETALLQGVGVPAVHIHKSAFIDHRIFRPLTDAECRYPAVHVANVEPFKRHRLAWGIRGIAVVTYDWRQADPNFAELEGYEQVGFANFDRVDGRIRLGNWVPSAQINAIINQSACGLILSAMEGNNNASAEYLLAGRPVVTTPSHGGRDEMYDSRHVTIVEPTAAAVQEAVEYWLRHPVPPEEIRESIMEKFRMHRRLFMEHINRVTGIDLMPQADADFWHPRFINKLRTRVHVADPA